MAGSSGYVYIARFPLTAVTIAKTLVQIKTGAAAIDIQAIKVFQLTKITSELQEIQASIWTGAFTAGTVTTLTPAPVNPNDPAALAVGGTAATGTNATVEASGGTQTIAENDVWNIINGSWQLLDIPEGRMRVPQASLFTLKLNTAPAASQSTGAYVKFIEYR